MTGTSILFQTGQGIAGQRSSPALSDIVEQGFLDSTNPPILYGVPVKNTSGKYTKLATNDLSAVILGMLTFPTIDDLSSVLNQALGSTTPNPVRAHGLLRKGNGFVSCLGTTAPAAFGQVYTRTADNGSTSRAVGTVEASPGTLTVTGAGATGKVGGDTIGTLSSTTSTSAQPGVYTARAVSATTYNVFDPNGVLLGRATNGTPFTTQVTFTITTAGATTVVGDQFNITVQPDCVVWPNATFTGTRDANNIVEMRLA